jgi:hypothetical protein
VVFLRAVVRAVVRAAGPDAGHESGAEVAHSAAECRICKGGPEEGKLVRAVLFDVDTPACVCALNRMEGGGRVRWGHVN